MLNLLGLLHYKVNLQCSNLRSDYIYHQKL